VLKRAPFCQTTWLQAKPSELIRDDAADEAPHLHRCGRESRHRIARPRIGHVGEVADDEGLDAGWTGTDRHERELPASRRLVQLTLGVVEREEGAATDLERVVDRLGIAERVRRRSPRRARSRRWADNARSSESAARTSARRAHRGRDRIPGGWKRV